MDEWMAFAAFAVEYLGMPVEARPLYSSDEQWKLKAEGIPDFVLMSGNIGQNRDSSYRRYPFLIRKTFSFSRRVGDLRRLSRIFPDSLRFFPWILFDGLWGVVKGVG